MLNKHAWFRSDTGTVVVSHHGSDAPPGTIHSYRNAYRDGYRWFQADLLVVKDDLIVEHAAFGRRRGFRRLTVTEARERLGRLAPTLTELLNDREMPEACWNFELKDRATVPHLCAVLQGLPPERRARVLVSAPFHRSIGRDLRNVFGRDVAVAAPWASGGTFGIRFLRPIIVYDCVQVHRWFAGRLGAKLPVHVWTVRTSRQLHRVLKGGKHPIFERSDAATRRLFEATGQTWPKPCLSCKPRTTKES